MREPLLIGGKIRRLRQKVNLTQVAMAARLGVSPSYLNLIEYDRRVPTRPLLLKLGEVLGIDPQELFGGDEARLHAELREVFNDPVFKGAGPDRDELARLIGAVPGTAKAILALYRAYLEAQENALDLGEQLADNPFLEATNHRLLTLLTSIRSFSEILRDNVDLAAHQRQQYIATVASESEKLTGLVNELFAFLAGAGLGAPRPGAAAATEVEDYMEAAGNYFADLEAAADSLRASLGPAGPTFETALWDRLKQAHGVAVEVTPLADGAQEAPFSGMGAFDEAGRCLRLPDVMPASSRRFEMARCLALLAFRSDLDALVSRAMLSEPAQGVLRRMLSGYVAGAILMPYDDFLGAANELRHDIERLSARFDTSFEQTCRRLSTLHRPGAEGIPFHFLRVDIAGNIVKRVSASGLRIPRFGGVCPRWNVHQAFLNPGRVETQVARLPDGTAYLFVARAEIRPGTDHHAPRRHFSVAIGCDVSFADAVVYADGLDLRSQAVSTPVGIHCRRCPREDCGDRVFPSTLR